MPARPNPVPPEGTFIIMQQRGHERIRFEVAAGKMVSIRVEPDSPATLDNATGAEQIEHSRLLMDTQGNC
ncbi:MAG TPA: hypothetical protein VF800_24535 [Telluria sp.]|jgi:hypothetical protein